MSEPQDHLVFVFGTLKEGFPNFATNRGTRVAGSFVTREPYPLYLVGERHTPWMVDQPGQGHRVAGQVFRVDDETLAAMDRLERISEPDGYRRVPLEVEDAGSANVLRVHAYLKPQGQFAQEQARLGPLQEYALEHAALYRPRGSAAIEVAPASADDLRSVAQAHVASWQAAYAGVMPADYLASLSVERREDQWRTVLSEGKSQLLVARRQTSVVGFVSFGPSRDADAPAGRGEIWALYARPDAWSSGVGRVLWQAAHERLASAGFDSVSLWVIAGNDRAIRFYERAGFEAEEGSQKEFELGGARLREIRMVAQNAG